MSNNNLFGNVYQEIGKPTPMSKLGENLRRFRKERGLSQSALAKLAGVRQNSIVAIEGGGGTKHLGKLATALKVKAADLDPEFQAEETLIVPGAELVGENDLDYFASVEGGKGEIVLSNEPAGRIKRPAPLLNVKGGYGILVRGESMIPVVRPGDIVLVNPHLPPRPEDVCVFISEKHGEFRATLKEYLGQTEDLWKVKRYRPRESAFTLKKADFPRCEVVVGKYNRR